MGSTISEFSKSFTNFMKRIQDFVRSIFPGNDNDSEDYIKVQNQLGNIPLE